MELELDSILLIILIFQLLFISLFLLTSKKGKLISNRLFGLFFLLMAINLLDLLLTTHGLYTYYIQIALVDDGFLFALGPLMYLYTKSIIYKDFKLSRTDYLHFTPFLIVTITLSLAPIFNPEAEQLKFMETIQQFEVPLIVNVLIIVMNLHAGLYLYFSFAALKGYRAEIRHQYSTVDALDLRWLKFTLESLLVILLLGFLHGLIPVVYSNSFVRISMVIFILFLLYFINRVILIAMTESAIFVGIAKPLFHKYQNSNLLTADVEHFARQLEMYMKKEKPYLDPKLSLNQLADSLNINPKDLSQVMNQQFHKSFFDYINSYRIELAKKLLIQSVQDNTTVLEILYQSGFNSKSSFNTFFKKQTGLTPTNFKNQQLKK